MRKLILAAAILLAACSTNSQTAFLKAEAGYTVVLQAAAHYVALPRCGSAGATQVCSQQAIVDKIRPAANSADAAVQAAEDSVTNNAGNTTAIQFAVTAAENATAALTAIMTQYNIPLK